MNRYLVVDYKEKIVYSLNKVDIDFVQNDEMTGSVTCNNLEEIVKLLEDEIQYVRTLLPLNERDDENVE